MWKKPLTSLQITLNCDRSGCKISSNITLQYKNAFKLSKDTNALHRDMSPIHATVKFMPRALTNPSTTLLDTLKYRKQATSLYNYKILLKRMDRDVPSSLSKGERLTRKTWVIINTKKNLIKFLLPSYNHCIFFIIPHITFRWMLVSLCKDCLLINI